MMGEKDKFSPTMAETSLISIRGKHATILPSRTAY